VKRKQRERIKGNMGVRREKQKGMTKGKEKKKKRERNLRQ